MSDVSEQQRAVERLREDVNVNSLWDCVLAFEGCTFTTTSGLPYTYSIRLTRLGEKGKEIFVSRKEKAITRSSVERALEVVMERGEALPVKMTTPKELNVFGASYIYPLFIRFGLVEHIGSDKRGGPRPRNSRTDSKGEVASDFSMDAFMEGIIKNTKARLPRGKKVNDRPDMVKPKETAPVKVDDVDDIIQAAVCENQDCESKNDFTNIENDSERQKVAAYIRVSSDSYDQENSYEVQEQYFHHLLSSNPNWTPVGIYSDFGITGTNKDKRTGFKRLLRHCQEGRIDRIVCKSVSRFARNTADFLTALKVLKENNVTINFEKEVLDTANPMNDFVVTTLAAVAQQESFSISENQNFAIERRFRNGEVRNIDIYGYRFNGKVVTMDSGYRYKDLDVVEDEAEVVRRIFNEVAQGKSFIRIAEDLNLDGVSAPKAVNCNTDRIGMLRKGIDQGWTAERVARIVRNERYVGDVVSQKTFTDDCLTHKHLVNKGDRPRYVIHDHHPAIVDRELYEKVKLIVNSNCGRTAPTRGYHSLSGMLVCGCCGRFLNVKGTRSGSVWFCPSASLNNGKNVCSMGNVGENQIDLLFRKAISEHFDQGGCKDFVDKIQGRLEAVQKFDSLERDRLCFGKLLMAIRVGNDATEKRLKLFVAQKEAMETKRKLLQDGSVTDERVAQKDVQIESEQKKLADGKDEEERVSTQFEKLEEYGEMLEANYEEREKAIEGMKGLSKQEFFDGLLEHVKAFVFSITVHSATHFTIHWFDDSHSDVVADNNIGKKKV